MKLRVVNAVIIVLILLCVVVFFARISLKKHYIIDEDVVKNDYDIQNLTINIRDTIQMILRERVEDLNLNEYETKKRKSNKTKLRVAVRNAPTGDIGAKSYVKDYIQNLLQTKFNVNESTIDNIIPFNEPDRLSANERFSIVLYYYKLKHDYRALEKLLTENGLDILRDGVFNVTETDIKKIYRALIKKLRYSDKLAIVCQIIYGLYVGHDIVDEIRDMKIDGLSGGVSGMSEEMFSYAEEYFSDEQNIVQTKFSYNSIWIFFQGKSIQLSCIGFESQKAFERVCKNIYRYNNPGQLSENKGYITNELKDGSRIVVARPPFSDSWMFILRKHQNGKVIKASDFVVHKNKEIVLKVVEFMVKGLQIIAITGGQGCGKTTFLRGLIEYLLPTYNLRIQELIFELGLRSVFPNRNIVTFKEIPGVSGQEGLDIQKKTDGDINILGEVATSPVANWVIQMSQVASLMTMFTHHAKTTKALIMWMRDALLKDGGLSNEAAATEEVVNCINFDIHMGVFKNKENYGTRYIERITEIIPIDDPESPVLYRTQDIVIFNKEKMEYELVNRFSERSEEEILNNLSDEYRAAYHEFFDSFEKVA